MCFTHIKETREKDKLKPSTAQLKTYSGEPNATMREMDAMASFTELMPHNVSTTIY